MKKYIITLLIAVLLVTACTKTKNISGKTYYYLKPSVKHDNGITDAELWYRKDNTNYYYTPSLDNSRMVPLMR